jgi:opine dehydrogenase
MPAANVLETGINNPNPMIHTPVYLLNFARVEEGQAPVAFDFHEWMTKGVERVHLAMDRERVMLARRLGLDGASYTELNQRSYGGRGRKIVASQEAVPKSAESLPPRFIAEDIPMGLVPLASLGRLLGVPTPAIDGVVTIAGAAWGEDFWQMGRTMAALGFEGWTGKDLVDFAASGKWPAAAV